ncbi:ABC transporter ATP-binding protein [Halogeometricum pallidum JCM 14848]|uniref:Molybdate/tungstate import ATP-binding protein WtpC n=1 Tax=Halogeometricum pallidum JCM 14848 TaxID=1227487 RepID=M0D6W2_HALPD|nr:ABC transporter ATP-binding protein [Halogeometricum pallidum]ELZ29894.1 ABC transporter ATP-binding protein [Halogeometricum pallidum JCM 14848]
MLELTGLRKSYAGFAFGPADLAVDSEVLCVLGPSGSGKTTLLSLVAGILSPDAGRIALDGARLDGVPPERRRTGLVFQDGALFPHMTARENVAYAADDGDAVETLADLLEIRDALDRKPAALSGGERQRVALARTLAADPGALLLDEPLSSLDAPIRNRLRDELHDLFDSLDIPVVYVTHDQRTATALGDRIAILRDGTVEQVGSPEDVLDRPDSEFVARFTGTDNLFDATVTRRGEGGDSEDAVVRLRVGDLRLRAAASADSSVGDDVTACVRPSRVRLGSPGDARIGEADSGDGGNVLRGTVRRWLNEGDGYRVVVDLRDAPVPLTARATPHRFERAGIRDGAAVEAVVPPAAIHLIR